MTNEELTVLAGMASDLIMERDSVDSLAKFKDKLIVEKKDLSNENKRLLDECNRLRESEANALNAAEEAKRERDEAREKLGKWIRFIGDNVLMPLHSAKDSRQIRLVVEGVVEKIKKFKDDNPIEFIEGGMAK